jgi:hypothetical protein
MEQALPGNLGARRDQDIALDLLKFVAITAGIGRHGAQTSGFTPGAGSKGDDQVAQLLELYSRCLRAVEAK